jgi:hypothetical protein
MARTVKHFNLHRIAGTELRVVSDVETGALPVIQVEEAVIRGYVRQGLWPHRWVTLFILQDLQPLVRQLCPEANLPPGGIAALGHRPVVNVYDLADLAGCHVFVNQQAMEKEGCWDDPLAIQGFLAHEHAHPLAENETTRAARRLRVELSLERLPSDAKRETHDRQWTADRQDRIRRLLTLLADKLCLYAPRELFANEVTILSGFGEALLYLDRHNVDNAGRSVAGREDLRRQLQQEVTQGNLTPAAADVLLLIGDLKGYMDLALEVAPFYRAGWESAARELEAVLETGVFPHLELEVPQAYAALQERYITLRADLTLPELMAWGEGVLDILAEVLVKKGLTVGYRLSPIAAKCPLSADR